MACFLFLCDEKQHQIKGKEARNPGLRKLANTAAKLAERWGGGGGGLKSSCSGSVPGRAGNRIGGKTQREDTPGVLWDHDLSSAPV